MRLPSSTSASTQRVRFGRYVTKRLRRARFEDEAVAVEEVTVEVRDRARACEDAAGPVQDAMPDRDHADDVLDDVAGDVRRQLAARSAEATKEPPYTVIFHKNIKYYTAAPLAQEVSRYQEFVTRLTTHLKEDDAVLSFVPQVEEGVALFQSASTAVDDARQALALKQTARDQAVDAWERQLEKTYGLLVQEVGRKQAERFFPRIRRGGTSSRNNDSDDV